MFDFLAHKLNFQIWVNECNQNESTRLQQTVANHLNSEPMSWAMSWARLTFRPGADVTPSWCMRSKKKSTRSKTAVFTSGFSVRMTTKHKETLYWE